MLNEQTIPFLLKTLNEAAPTDSKVLSVYLDTTAGRYARQAHLMSYRDLCKKIRPQLPEAERAHFEVAAAQVERLLLDGTGAGHPGLAVFASGSFHGLYLTSLPRRPVEQMSWDNRPHLEPLQAILDDEERVAVVLFNSRRARLFTVYLGQLDEHGVVDDYVPRKQKSGGWAALAQSHFARRREDHLLRHAAHTIAALNGMLRSHPADRLLIGGPVEELAVLRHHLPKPLRNRLVGTLHLDVSATSAEILRTARQATEASERNAELASVEELLDAATSPRVALGATATLAAVAENRLHRLLIADTYTQSGGECLLCGCLVAGPGPCPACGGRMEPIDDLGERVVQRALGQGARVDVVSGEAAALLQTKDGLGAWTRY